MMMTKFGVIPSQITDSLYLATDADFSGTTNGDFQYIGTETELEIPSTIKGIAVTSYYYMFGTTNGRLVTRVKSINTNITTMEIMFRYNSATTLDLSELDTSSVTTMRQMFKESSLPTLDLSNFDTSSVITMDFMFQGISTTSLDLSSFDTSNVTNTSGMFYAASIPTLDLSSFDMSNVTNTNVMFYNCSATTGYARTQADADILNASSEKPSTLTFVVKS